MALLLALGVSDMVAWLMQYGPASSQAPATGTMVQVPLVVENYAEMLKIFGIIYCQLGLPAIDSQYIRLPRGLSGIFLPAGSGSAAWA